MPAPAIAIEYWRLPQDAKYVLTSFLSLLSSSPSPSQVALPFPNAPPSHSANAASPNRLIDMIYAVRSDETTHRFVNHSLASLKPEDVNPFAMGEPPMTTKGTKIAYVSLLSPYFILGCDFGGRLIGVWVCRFEREDSIEYITKGQEELAEARKTGTRRV